MANSTLNRIGLLALPMLVSASLNAAIFSDTVGVVKIEIAAAASPSSPTLTFLSTSMSSEVVYQGVVSAGGTGTITIASDDWTANQFSAEPHYVIVASGAREGEILGIASNTVNTLTLDGGPASEDQSDLIGQSVRINKHNTIASIFGDNPAAGTVEKGDKSTADHIVLYNPVTELYNTYYYNTIATSGPPFNQPFHVGWINANDRATDASKTPIFPDDGFIYKRVTTSSYTISVSGSVITSSIKVPVVEGYNLISVPYPVDKSITLATSGLAAHLQSGDKANADHLVFYDNINKLYETYYINNVASSGPPFNQPFYVGWINANDRAADASNTTIPAGKAIFILRRSATPFNWTFQSVTAP